MITSHDLRDLGFRNYFLSSRELSVLNASIDENVSMDALGGDVYSDPDLFDSMIGLLFKSEGKPVPSHLQSTGPTKHELKWAKNCMLMMAINERDLKTAKIAIDIGAQLDESCYFNGSRTIAIIAAAKNNDYPIVECLLNAGADPNASQMNGENALAIASNFDYVRIAQLLLEHDANPNIIAHHNITPLAMAESPEMIRLLVKHGADPNIPDDDGDLPIISRLDNRDTPSVIALIEAGTNLDFKNNKGKTPRDHARYVGFGDLSKYETTHEPSVSTSGTHGADAHKLKMAFLLHSLTSNVAACESGAMNLRKSGRSDQADAFERAAYSSELAARSLFELLRERRYSLLDPIFRNESPTFLTKAPHSFRQYKSLFEGPCAIPYGVSLNEAASVIEGSLAGTFQFAVSVFQIAVKTSDSDLFDLCKHGAMGSRGLLFETAYAKNTFSSHVRKNMPIVVFASTPKTRMRSAPISNMEINGFTKCMIPADYDLMFTFEVDEYTKHGDRTILGPEGSGIEGMLLAPGSKELDDYFENEIARFVSEAE